MSQSRARRVLLVEDSDVQSETLVRRFEEAGYAVTLAATYAEANRELQTGHFHLAVIDVCLDLSEGATDQGLDLLKDIEILHLRQVMPAIIVTQYSSYDLVKNLLESGAAFFVEKESGYIARLLDKTQTLFQEKVGINFDLNLLANSEQQIERVAAYVHQAEDEPQVSAESFSPQVFDLIGKMFQPAESVMLDYVAEGLSGAAVLRVRPTYPHGLTQPIVAKIGRWEKIEKEQQRYLKNVKFFLSGNHATQLDACYMRDLGGLVYTLNLPDVSKDLKGLYQKKSASQIVGTLERLFRVTCAAWYANRQPARFANLRDLYLDAFELTDKPNRIPIVVRDLHPEIDWTLERIVLAPLTGEYPNPLRWLANDRIAWMPVSTCITHGDLHADNILINEEGECWLIDFYRTYPSHILRDFVILETDLKYRVMGEIAPQDFLELERALIDLEPGRSFQPTLMMPNQARKAGEVIAGLRAQAWSLLDWQSTGKRAEAQREYLASLLMATLNVIRLRHLRTPAMTNRRELALLSTLLICDKLEQLGTA